MRGVLLGLGIVTATACGGPSGARAGRCDQAALRAAADATDAMLRAWNPEHGAMPDYRVAVRGLLQACPNLPAGFLGYLEYDVQPRPPMRSAARFEAPLHNDPEALRPMRAHCPGYVMVMASMVALPSGERAQVYYDGCDLGRVGLIDRAALGETLGHPMIDHAHALYLWLVDDGAPPAVARALMRPILAATDDALEAASELPHLPVAARGPAPLANTPDVRVTLDEVTFKNQPQAQLRQGRLVVDDPVAGSTVTLRGNLALASNWEDYRRDGEGSQAPLHLAIAADPRSPWATIGAIIEAAGEVGYDHIDAYALAPEPLHPVVALPLLASGEAPKLELGLTGTSIVLRCDGGESTPVLTALSAALDRCGGGRLRLHVDPETRWQRVVDILPELAGHATIVALGKPPSSPGPL